jgi:hypothetical protein
MCCQCQGHAQRDDCSARRVRRQDQGGGGKGGSCQERNCLAGVGHPGQVFRSPAEVSGGCQRGGGGGGTGHSVPPAGRVPATLLRHPPPPSPPQAHTILFLSVSPHQTQRCGAPTDPASPPSHCLLPCCRAAKVEAAQKKVSNISQAMSLVRQTELARCAPHPPALSSPPPHTRTHAHSTDTHPLPPAHHPPPPPHLSPTRKQILLPTASHFAAPLYSSSSSPFIQLFSSLSRPPHHARTHASARAHTHTHTFTSPLICYMAIHLPLPPTLSLTPDLALPPLSPQPEPAPQGC